MMKRSLTLLFLSIVFSIGAWAIDQDSEGYYCIGSVQDWRDFAAIVNGGTTNVNARMTVDIDLGDDQTKIGATSENDGVGPFFSGIFDGQGHTLTIAYTGIGSGSVVAPFTKINGATIKNLHVTGSINSGGLHAAVISDSFGTSLVENVWNELNITSTRSGWVECGSIVGCAKSGNLTIKDCLFTGSISATGGYNGCFVGYNWQGTTTMTNCLSLGTFSYPGGYNSWTSGPAGTHTNCYVKQFHNNDIPAAMQVSDDALSDGTTVAALQAGREETAWVQDPLTNQPMLALFAGKYTVPSSGLGTFCAKANFTLPEGLEAYYCKNYNSTEGTIGVSAIEGVVPAETGVLLRGEPGETYTLTISDETAATVTDNALVAVTEQTAISQTSGEYTNFGLSGGVFKKVNANGGTVKANRAYLHILTSDLPSLARSISLVWNEDVTSVGKVNLNLNDNANYYDLQGRRIVNPAKGLYIVNGKKVIIK